MPRTGTISVVLWFAMWLPMTVARCDEPVERTVPEDGETSPKEPFLRLTRDSKGRPTALQTAIVRFEADDAEREGLVVDLIGAVHIGEKAYFETLNHEFEQYDALLYELVAPEDARPKQGDRSEHPIAKLQTGMKGLLALDFQLDHIDYGKPNFVHADMSPDDFAKSMASRGESIWTILERLMERAMTQQAKNDDGSAEAKLFAGLFSNNRSLKLKRLLAEQFEDIDGAMEAFNGPEGSTLITERNKKALSVLRREMDKGKKRLGIFYGAGHMDDMAQRLVADFNLDRKQTRWLTAWDLRSKSAKKKAQAAAAGE
ncbi:MAG TPA: hypothetical protein VMV69_14115 [Pirellulales bacterium]|nr:hypothetical protein [Pirellulales bacterium]